MPSHADEPGQKQILPRTSHTSKSLAGSAYTAGRYSVVPDRTLNRPNRSFTARFAPATFLVAVACAALVGGLLLR